MQRSKLATCFGVLALPLLTLAQEIGGPRDFHYFGGGLGNRGRGSLLYGIKQNNLALQFGIFNNLDFGQDRFSNALPPSDITFLGNYRTQPGGGLDLLFFPGEREQSLYFGVGIYGQSYSRVWRSPSTEQLFDFGQEVKFEAAFSLGFMASTGPQTTFGFGFHTHLGWHLTFGSKRF
jgi:hypothetical protein